MSPSAGRRRGATALMALALLVWPMAPQASSHGLRDGLTVSYGSPPAPRLSLEALDGGRRDLAAMRGRVVVVNFWATWCPPCVEELPTLQRLWERAHVYGLDILAVNAGERPETIRAFLGALEPGIAFPVLLDRDGEAFRAWRVRGLPKTFVVDKRGRIVYEAEGGRDMNSEHIHGRLRALLDE